MRYYGTCSGFGVVPLMVLLCVLSVGVEAAPNGMSFIPLLPAGGSVWSNVRTAQIALHPSRNRLYTVGSATDGQRLIHRESVTGGVVASSTTSGRADWQCHDIEAWGGGDEVLVAWGTVVASERSRGMALERLDVKTGRSSGADESIRFIAFDVDEIRAVAWGIEDQGEAYYLLTSVSLPDHALSSTEISIATADAVVRDVIVDATHEVLYGFFQPTRADYRDSTEPGGFILAYQLPDAVPLGRVEIPKGQFQMGGMALDVQAQALYTIPREGGGALHRIDAARMVLEATFEESQIAEGYRTGGALAVEAPSGNVFLSNNNDLQADARVLLLDLNTRTPQVVGRWSGGVDPSRLVYDPQLDQLYAASWHDQLITVIAAGAPLEIIQSPMAIQPGDLAWDRAKGRVLLLSKSGQVHSVDSKSARVTDRVESFGVRSSTIQMDGPRGRFIIGSGAEEHPAVFEGGSVSKVAQLSEASSAIAVAEKNGLLFQIIGSGDTSSIQVVGATDGTLQRRTSPSARFARTLALAVDEQRTSLYGITANRGAGLGPGIWYFDWGTEASEDLILPPTAAAYWNSFSLIAVEPLFGTIGVVGYNALLGYSLLVYENPSDSEAMLYSFGKDVTAITDWLFDSVNWLGVALGTIAGSSGAQLFWMDFSEFPVVTIGWLDLPSRAEHMTLDRQRGILWLASENPSGFYQLPWPPEGVASKHAKAQAALSTIDLSVQGLPGRNRLRWRIEPPPEPDARVEVLREDGPLAAFRPILPAGLPVGATEYVDTDVSPGVPYRYRLELAGSVSSGTAEAAAEPALARETGSVLVRPLTLLDRVAQGESGVFTVLLDGVFRANRTARLMPGHTPELEQAGITLSVTPERLIVPGAFNLGIRSRGDSPPGRWAIPVEIEIDGGVEPLWLFTDVYVPFGEGRVDVPTYPAESRAVSIHTDSRLREDANNLLVLKGNIGALSGNEQGTALAIKVDPGDGHILEYSDLLASNGFYATSIQLPEALGVGTVVRARVTWLGSSTSLGGTSPILNLPVGAYSVAGGGKGLEEESESPEPAVFIRGLTPQDLEPTVPQEEDLDQTVQAAAGTLLAEFIDQPRTVSHNLAEVEDALPASGSTQTLLVYAIGDTDPADGALLLPDGRISPASMAEMIAGVSAEQTILIIEGPGSYRFAEAGVAYPRGTIVLTSSGEADGRRNKMAPWPESFSARLFENLGKNWDLSRSFRWAKNAFIMLGAFGGLQQQPEIQDLDSQAGSIHLKHRFLPAGLPDLLPPEILGITTSRVEIADPTPAYQLEVLVADNQDTSPDIEVWASLISLRGSPLESLDLDPPGADRLAHAKRIHTPAVPGFGLSVTAKDRAGNMSHPVDVWVSSGTQGLFFDYNDDGLVDYRDLFLWLNLVENDPQTLYDGWLYDFLEQWHSFETQ